MLRQQNETQTVTGPGPSTASSPVTELPAPDSGRPDFDMDDRPDMPYWPGLLQEKLWQPTERCDLYDAYRAADKAAIRSRWWLKILAVSATSCGALAVISAIVELARVSWADHHSLEVLEVALAFLALAAAAVGAWGLRLPRRWLCQRHKAERCRFAKFRYLIRPSLWGLPDPDTQDALALLRDTAGLRVGWETLKSWSEEGVGPTTPMMILDLEETAAAALVPAELQAALPSLVEYYRVKRLRFQRHWFTFRRDANRWWDRMLLWLPPFLFFAGVSFAVAHGVADWSLRSFEWMLVAAAALPVLGTAVRTFRMAFEFARNTSRFQAARSALGELDGLLSSALDAARRQGTQRNWLSVFQLLEMSEDTLEAEQREWLRLMMEAEWYG